jgi:hypothetical protein
MLCAPFLAGVLVAGQPSLAVLLAALSVTLFFVARESLVTWWRSYRRGFDSRRAGTGAAACLLLAGVTGIPLVLIYRLVWLVPMAVFAFLLVAINAEQAVRRRDRTIGAEVLAVVGLTLSGPVAYYASVGRVDGRAFWLWGSSAAFFASSLFYVRLRVHNTRVSGGRARTGIKLRCALYHALLLSGLLGIWLINGQSVLVVFAFAPIVVRAAWELARPGRKLNLKRTGILELVYSVAFTALISLSLRG